MIVIPNEWPTTEGALALKFVAQAFHEAVGTRTFGSFRFRTLDVVTAIDELSQVCENVIDSGVDIRNVAGVADELIGKLRDDPIISSKFEHEISAFDDLLKNALKKSSPLQDVLHASKVMKDMVGDEYKEGVEKRILEIFEDKARWLELRVLISSYVSFLVNRGYSRRFIDTSVKKDFSPITFLGQTKGP